VWLLLQRRVGTAGGHDISAVMEPGEVTKVGTEIQGEVILSQLTITLYDVSTVIQDVLSPDDSALVVATVVDRLRCGWLTWLGKTIEPLGQSLHGVGVEASTGCEFSGVQTLPTVEHLHGLIPKGGRPSVWRRHIHGLLARSWWRQGAHSGGRCSVGSGAVPPAVGP
jgi:hypothetical protein